MTPPANTRAERLYARAATALHRATHYRIQAIAARLNGQPRPDLAELGELHHQRFLDYSNRARLIK